uniref:ARAD1B05236p n=1 Tax=Blastobotrys adeninivorans TaxID=409370 RepID=A0A060TB36_BLAAD
MSRLRTSNQIMASLWELINKKFEAARGSGHLVFTESTSQVEDFHGVKYLYTLAPKLHKKPNAEKKPDSGAPKLLQSPWIKPEPELTVVDEFESNYRIVLNKFAIVPNHFLLVTKEQEPQKAPLSPEDLAAAYKALNGVNSSAPSGTRFVGFYNAGPHSGASIDHKHIQFVPLPLADGYYPFVDELVKINQGFTDTQKPLIDHRMAFAHFIVPIDKNPDQDHLGFRYSHLLSRVMTTLREHEVPPAEISYNFLFTEEWMMAVPRKSSETDGRGFNSLSMIGMLLAKSEDDITYFKEKGPGHIVAELGFAPVDERKEEDYDY